MCWKYIAATSASYELSSGWAAAGDSLNMMKMCTLLIVVLKEYQSWAVKATGWWGSKYRVSQLSD